MQTSFSSRLARTAGPWFPARPARIDWPGGVISFSFDDFPRSAFANGGAILERHHARGTYYAALGLAGQDGDTGELCGRDDTAAVHARGHELACHSHSHLDCSRVARRTILADIAANAAEFASLIKGFVPTSFAYPFGAVSLAARRALAPRFVSCRGIGGGINSGSADLAHLRSQRIYCGDFDGAALRRLIDRNSTVGGWLIFYTHDVASAPSRYGCTPEQLEAVVSYATARCEVLPVGTAARRLAMR